MVYGGYDVARLASGSHRVPRGGLTMRSYLAATAILLVALPAAAAAPKAPKLATARKEFNELLKAHPNLKIFHEGVKKQAGITKHKVWRAVSGMAAAASLVGEIKEVARGDALGAVGDGLLYMVNASNASSEHRQVVEKTREANTKTVEEALWRAKNVSGTYTIAPEKLRSWQKAGLINEIESEPSSR
jgi:hypothetical protein